MEIGKIIVEKVMVYYKSTDKYTQGHAGCSLLQFSDMLVCVCSYGKPLIILEKTKVLKITCFKQL